MIKVICRITAHIAGLSFVAAVPPQGVLLCWRGVRPGWAGAWFDRLLAISRLVKKGETPVGPASLYTSGRVRVAEAGKPRAEFARGSYREFRFQALREAEDFSLLMSRMAGKARA